MSDDTKYLKMEVESLRSTKRNFDEKLKKEKRLFKTVSRKLKESTETVINQQKEIFSLKVILIIIAIMQFISIIWTY